jgi:hypothetical protein
MAASLNATTAKKISDAFAKEIVAALDRNTAALLTVATLVLRSANDTSVGEPTSDAMKHLILETFNRFVSPVPPQA